MIFKAPFRGFFFRPPVVNLTKKQASIVSFTLKPKGAGHNITTAKTEITDR